MRAVLPVCALLLLGGCAELTGPQAVEQSRPTVTYRYGDGDLAEAERRADDYCDRYSMNARLVDTGRQGGDRVAMFECR